MKKVLIYAVLSCILIGCAIGCNQDKKEIQYGMVCDTPRIKENPFTWSSFTGLQNFQKKHEEIKIKYLESASPEAILPNLEQLADEGSRLIWGIGGTMKEAITKSVKLNPDVTYLLMDAAPEMGEEYKNLSYVEFQSEQSAFLAGYIAGYVTETNQIGFVGGKEIPAVVRFESGFRQGVQYAAKEQQKEMEVKVTYTDDFQERMIGQEAALALFDEGCDVLFQAAGECGKGVIDAAAMQDKWVIGVDVDQYEEAPSVVLCSVLKHTATVVEELTELHYKGEKIGGQTYVYGVREDGVGITKDNPNLEEFFPGLYERMLKVKEQIIKEEIEVLGHMEKEG